MNQLYFLEHFDVKQSLHAGNIGAGKAEHGCFAGLSAPV